MNAAKFLPLRRPESLGQLVDVNISFEESNSLPKDEPEGDGRQHDPSGSPGQPDEQDSDKKCILGTRHGGLLQLREGRRPHLLEPSIPLKFRSTREIVEVDAINRNVDFRNFEVSSTSELVDDLGTH